MVGEDKEEIGGYVTVEIDKARKGVIVATVLSLLFV